MKKACWYLVACVLALLVAGCRGTPQIATSTPIPVLATATSTMTATATVAPSATPTATQAPPTPTLVPPSPTVTPTSIPPSPTMTHTPVPPTPTATRPAPVPTVQPGVVRIQFAPGTTSATLTGRIVRKEAQGVEFGTDYLIRAFASQTMTVAITSPNNDVLVTVVGADGSPLKRYEDGLATWTGQLYATQDYIITPASVGKSTDYALAVSVSTIRLLDPVRIQFAPGTTGATVQGDVETGVVARYVFRASAGQKLQATIEPAVSFSIAVEAQDGSFWSGPAFEGTLAIDALPATEDYTITVAVAPPAQTAHYTLKVTVVAGSGG